MSRDAEKGGFAERERLWSGRDKGPPAQEKVLPLKPERPAFAPPAQHDRAYVAFETCDRAERLHIMRGAGPSRFPNYNYLLDISFDHHLQSAFSLIYTFMVVEVTGSNLGPIVHAVSLGTCARIREFHHKLYDPPAGTEPVIVKIQIVAADEKE